MCPTKLLDFDENHIQYGDNEKSCLVSEFIKFCNDSILMKLKKVVYFGNLILVCTYLIPKSKMIQKICLYLQIFIKYLIFV